MLASLVSAGTLPPLEQRLPEKADVMVEPVVDEIGRYGGNWTMAWTGPGDNGRSASRRRKRYSDSTRTEAGRTECRQELRG